MLHCPATRSNTLLLMHPLRMVRSMLKLGVWRLLCPVSWKPVKGDYGLFVA